MTKKFPPIFQLRTVMICLSLLLFIGGPPNIFGQSGSGEVVTGKSSTTNSKSSKASKTTRKSPAPARANRPTSTKVDNSKAVEIAYWDSIKNSTNPEDFNAYLRKYADGEFTDIARNRIASLETARREAVAAEARRTDLAYWESIRSSNSVGDFRLYVDKFPSGAFVDIARTRIHSLEAAASEAAARQRVERERAERERNELARTERKIPDTEYSTGLTKTDEGKIRPAKGYHWVKPGDPNNSDVELHTGIYRTQSGTLRPKTSYRWVNPYDQSDFRVELLPGVSTPVEVPSENTLSFEVIHYHETGMFEEDSSCKGTITILPDGRLEFKSSSESSHNITFTCSTITKLRYPADYGSEVKFSLYGQKQDFFSSDLKSYMQKKCSP